MADAAILCEGHFYLTGKGVPNFLIVFHCSFVDILHRFLTNPRNVAKILVLTLPPPIQPQI